MTSARSQRPVVGRQPVARGNHHVSQKPWSRVIRLTATPCFSRFAPGLPVSGACKGVDNRGQSAYLAGDVRRDVEAAAGNGVTTRRGRVTAVMTLSRLRASPAERDRHRGQRRCRPPPSRARRASLSGPCACRSTSRPEQHEDRDCVRDSATPVRVMHQQKRDDDREGRQEDQQEDAECAQPGPRG